MASSARDPHLAPFVGDGRLGASFYLGLRGGGEHLGFLGPMDRGEAERTGLPLFTPDDLDVARWARDGAEGADLWAPVLATALLRAGLAPSSERPPRVALAGHLSAGLVRATCAQLEADGWAFAPGESLVEALGRAKTREQVEAIRAAGRAVAEAYQEVARALVDGMADGDGVIRRGGTSTGTLGEPLRVGALRSRIGRVLAAHGLEQPVGNIVAPGAAGAIPHSVGENSTPIRAGDTLVVDLFPRDRLHVDCTRTFVVGPVPDAVRAAYDDVLSALELAESKARPGRRGWALQGLVCEHLAARGHATPIHQPGTIHGYVHGLGHGVGWQVHELPSFREHASEDDGRLTVGDVFTLEPGLYRPLEDEASGDRPSDDGWAIRIEDTFALVADDEPGDLESGWRLERLTTSPRSLDPRAQLVA